MFHQITKRTLISLAVASACAQLTAYTWAQDQESSKVAEVDSKSKAKKSDADKNEVQEITVTATRRATSLLKTPLAVTAFSQEKLTKQGITNLAGISGELPNVQMDGQANDSAVKITIRGITATNFTEIGDPSAGLHIDGLYSPRPQGAQALMFDLDQVEVLRGPQGTLFGRNSTAGSINIIPAKPEFGSTYGSASLETGSLNLRNINVIQNIAVNEIVNKLHAHEL
ncbi:MAG: TonB-dependent receptor plug domain-containing protein, partial [Pseudomonadota bacterium]